MPNTFTDNRDRWIQMSDVDYLGQFVKAWLAFNAWYRSAYTETQDRAIVEEIKWNTNPIASRLRLLLQHDSENAAQLRSEIGLLHNRLENYEIHSGKGSDRTRITLSNIVIRTEPPFAAEFKYRGYEGKAERLANGRVEVSITDKAGAQLVGLQQPKFDLVGLQSAPGFPELADGVKTRCRTLYGQMSPRQARDLKAGEEPEIICGAHRFRCGPDFLFAGVVEVVYLLRCCLFHGELVPTREASACYEPAFRIVRRFLDCVV